MTETHNCASCRRFVACEHALDNYWFCANCRSAYCRDVPGGFVFRDNAVHAEDIDEWEWEPRAVARGWYRVQHGDWYTTREAAPTVPLGYHTDVFEHCQSKHDVTTSKALLLGVELEMEPRNPEHDAQNEIVKRLNGPVAPKYICTHDGSLDYGVEMVTLPYTLDEHKLEFGWGVVLDRVKHIAKSGSNTHNCGMHVHVNRRALTPLTIGKMLMFLNHDDTNELVELIAQRRSNGFSKKKEIRHVTDINMDREDISRYERLNVRPHHTVEFRIFKGNLRPERVLKNLEFVHATVEFCKSASIQDVTKPEAFIAYIKKNRGTYSNLLRFLQEREYHSESPVVIGRMFNGNKRTHKSATPALEEI